MKKIKQSDYIFLSTTVRAREAKMLTDERAAAALAADSFEDAARIIAECSMPDMSGMTDGEMDAALRAWRAAAFADIESRPEATPVVSLFRMKYDYHNVKAAIKANAEGIDGSYAMSHAGRVSPDAIVDVLLGGKSAIPEPVQAAMSEAQGILARTQSAQLADFAVDKAYAAEFLAAATAMKVPAFVDYARLMIDALNLRAAVRTLRMGRDMAFLKGALLPGGTVTIKALSPTGEELNRLYLRTKLHKAVESGLAAIQGAPLTEFERICDDVLTEHLSAYKNVTYGPEPVFNYLAAVETAISTARMILTGKMYGIEESVIRSRLRKSNV